MIATKTNETSRMATSVSQQLLDRAMLYGSFALVALFAFFPIYWMLVTSLTPAEYVFQFPPKFFPTQITFDHYQGFFDNPDLLRYFRNSLLVAFSTAIGSLVVSSYGCCRRIRN